jgi:ubiquinone/menaquinone biosynthesis C-methylase UbiE
LVALARAVGHSGRVYGIDLSPRMNDSAQQRISRAGLADRVELHCGDALRLPAGWGSVDAIFMSFTLELFDTPEIPQLLRECLRVLRPGGRICVVSLSKAGGTNWMRSLYEWGHEVFPTVLDCRPIFVQRSLEEAGLQTTWSTLASLWGLPVEIVLASKP